MNVAPVAWEQTACPLCRTRAEDLLLEVDAGEDTYRLVRCRACGMGYLNPRPTLDSIGHYYPPDYECYQTDTPRHRKGRWRRHLERLVLSRYYGYPPRHLHWYENLLATAARFWVGPGRSSMTAVPYFGRGRLLDYGAGSGWFAQRMRQRGWDVVAMDFNRAAAERVQRRYQLPVLVGTLPHPEVKPESFDAITMGAVLEHVHEPHPLIEAAARALRPGGLLAISVPNLDSWPFRYFGAAWWSLELPRHLLHFTPKTLRLLAESHGLVVRDLRLLGRTSWMRRSLAIAREHRQRRFFVRIGRWPLVPSLLTRWTTQTRQSDCLFLIASKTVR